MPDAATKTTPGCPLGVRKLLSLDDSPAYSGDPQLMETALTPGWAAAYRTAAYISTSAFELASTRRIWAAGAMAWAHSTSREISTAHVALADGRVVVLPV